jgi:hypothetical protein
VTLSQAKKELSTAGSAQGYDVEFSQAHDSLLVHVFKDNRWCAFVTVPIVNGSVDVFALGDAINKYLYEAGRPMIDFPEALKVLFDAREDEQ